MPAADHAIPTPLEAAAARENFPVAGWFIAPSLRPAVRSFYAFARAADDVADDPALSSERKIARLDEMETALSGAPGAAHLRDLLVAFRMDARNQAIASRDALDRYCRYSAAPVGRFLLDLHGEGGAVAESDALCAALQILNHVRDVRADQELLGRCYIPRPWLAAPKDRRAALGRMLDHAGARLAVAAPLPSLISSRRLAAQSAAILTLAGRLLSRLRTSDPWLNRVRLEPLDWLAAAAAGIARFVRGR